MDNQTLILGILALAGFVVVAILFYASKRDARIAELIPPEVLNRVLDFADNMLIAGLGASAKTESPDDDLFYITALRLRGWTVTGNVDTGYTMTPPPKEIDG